MTRFRRVVLCTACSALLLLTLAACIAFGQAQPQPFRPGEWMVAVASTMPRADVDALAATIGATVARTYQPLDAAGNISAYFLKSTKAIDAAATVTDIVTLKADARVIKATPNNILRPMQSTTGLIPNDPRWNLQWDMTQINMPLAWTLEKGKANIVVADIDTGTDTTHPDFDKTRIFNPFNAITGTTNANPVSPNIHGTLTAGYIAATTNNSIGQAGVTWENVKLMPILAGVDDPTKGFALSDLVTAVQYVQTQAAKNPGMTFVTNMSLGGQATADDPTGNTNIVEDAILTAASKGILFVIAAANSGDTGNPPVTPARLAGVNNNVICVTATGVQGSRAFYSEFRPYSTIAAPGGDNQQGAGIACLVPVFDGSYAVLPDPAHNANGGTSSAAPHVSGVAALLLSVPGVKVGDIKPLIEATAKRVPGFAVPSPEYGYGIVDAYAALLKVAFGVTILTPEGTGGKAIGQTTIPQPSETLRPEIRIQIAQIAPANLTIKIDNGDPIAQCTSTSSSGTPCYTIENITVTGADPNGGTGTVPLTYQAVIRNADLSPGQHQIDVIGTAPATGGGTPLTVTDTRNITIQPHVIPAGRSMISFPYYEYIDVSGNLATDPNSPSAPNNITPQIYLGTNFRLARWLPDQERYVFYSSFGQSENAASFTPADVIPHLDGDPATAAFAKWPIGLGFWADLESNKPILTKGRALTDRAFVIPLKSDPNGGASTISWNMIGDPFPFDVPFNALLVDTPLGRISIQEAANRGYILPNIYTFDGATGYTFQTLPAGALRAWTGHWVGITSNVDLSLVVPPAIVSRAASTTTRSATAPTSGGTGWTLQIGAHTRNLHDAYNFIGTGSRALDGYDQADVPKPPMAGPFVSLGISHSDWTKRAGMYAQDIRAAGPGKTWSLVANTDQPNSDITVSWNAASLPRNVRLTLKDDSTGQSYDMRSRSAITFNSGDKPGPRMFTVSSSQSLGRSIRVANLNVRSAGRASGTSVIGFSLTGDATYEVRILSATGNTVSTVGSRAAATTGDVSLLWNGRDNSGKSVAAGTYIVQVRATTADGESVKAIQPFTVVR